MDYLVALNWIPRLSLRTAASPICMTYILCMKLSAMGNQLA